MSYVNQRQFARNYNNSRAAVISGALRGAETAEAAGITVRAYAPALLLSRKLLAAGFDPDTALHLYRKNGTLALRVRSLGEAARLVVEDSNTGRPRFKPVRKERWGTAPSLRENGSALGEGWTEWPAAADEGAA